MIVGAMAGRFGYPYLNRIQLIYFTKRIFCDHQCDAFCLYRRQRELLVFLQSFYYWWHYDN